jgi:hypothetical protein
MTRLPIPPLNRRHDDDPDTWPGLVWRIIIHARTLALFSLLCTGLLAAHCLGYIDIKALSFHGNPVDEAEMAGEMSSGQHGP